MSAFTDKDKLFMQRALELAQLGLRNVSPNPMVGCVIVHNDEIIGEGWHQEYGQAHAEVNAVNSVADLNKLKESAVYVTLEPCAHHGKTPPCADLLVQHQVNKVIIACTDPNPLVGGKGIERLKDAGIEVIKGLLEPEAVLLNRRFFTYLSKNRPYVILKWAQTANGYTARTNYDSKWISNEFSRKLVHKWRSEEDAIMVGTNTARYDNPTLNVRDWTGKDPIRIVIDKNLNLNNELNLFTTEQPTICYNCKNNKVEGNTTYVKIDDRANFLEQILNDLKDREIQSVFVEGGSQLLKSFIEQNLWDEARIFTGDIMFDDGIVAPTIEGKLISKEDIMGDDLRILRNEKG